MKLFLALFRRSYMPNGHIWRGKDRLKKPVTLKDLQKLKNSFEIEENNMFLLRHPYLTPEQSKGHTSVHNRRYANYVNLLQQKKDFKDNITIESQLGHLRYREPWD